MNETFRDDNRDEQVAQKLNQVVEQTHVSSQFAAELEERLRSRYLAKPGRFSNWFRQISPTVRWVALMGLLALVLSLSIKTVIPTPQPASEGTLATQDSSESSTPIPAPTLESSTPLPDGEVFDYGDVKLILNAALPDSPAQANIYTVLGTIVNSPPATAEYARALADQFGIVGEVYTLQEQYSDQTALMVTDGKQQLIVRAENQYTYTSDMVKSSRNYSGFPHENAEAIIREYLQSHGFASDFRMEPNNSSAGYRLASVTPDGLPIMGDMQTNMLVTLDEEGAILSVNASLVSYDPTPLGSYGIISAQEAVQMLVNESQLGGTMEYGHGSPDPTLEPPQYWYHDYPDNQPVMIHGNLSLSQPVDANAAPIIFLDNVPVTGNIAGMEALENFAFVQATGQFIVENGIRKFSVDSWNPDVQLAITTGYAQRNGEQIILVNGNDNTEYVLLEPPADLPLDTSFPDSQLVAYGAVVDEQFYWTVLRYYPDRSQMGGGGGGGGMFYQLNLSGTPVPFPTAVPTQPSVYSSDELSLFPQYTVKPGDSCGSIGAAYRVSIQSIIDANNLAADCIISDGQTLTIPTHRLEGERGIVTVRIYEKPDGRQRTAYIFESEKGQFYLTLRGDNLEALQASANRPIKIWGDTGSDKTGMFLTMERFEVVYPDLQFQVLTGTQETKQLNGTEVVLFTTDGKTYIQMTQNGSYPDFNYFQDSDEVKIEALPVPDETYEGYPALRVFNVMPAINPVTGEPMEFPRTVNEIEIMPDPYGNADSFIPPNITIENLELAYYVIDPTLQVDDPETAQLEYYLQPIWHFWGHNDNGDEVHYLVQALKQEYLLPIEP